jgi:hypothetical protein
MMYREILASFIYPWFQFDLPLGTQINQESRLDKNRETSMSRGCREL